ncbi:MAG: XrtA system polysaccharide deacetylase [Gammaproteobacteria bacterium]
MQNALTIDVEDYFQVEAFSAVIDRQDWPDYPSRVEKNTLLILDLLDTKNVKATFFVLGWVAKHFPALVKKIAQQGHEVASHGLSHRLVYAQTPQEFRSETRESKEILEDLAQQPVIGYRAATYSITKSSLWALDILAEEGFRYDSSIFPVRHDKYGIPHAKTTLHMLKTVDGNSLIECPLSVLPLGGFNVPVAGGGYFRFFPYRFTKWALAQLNRGGDPFVFYLHPWELDPGQPRIRNATALSRFRHYLNLDRCLSRLVKLIDDFSFAPMCEILSQGDLLEPRRNRCPSVPCPIR